MLPAGRYTAVEIVARGSGDNLVPKEQVLSDIRRKLGASVSLRPGIFRETICLDHPTWEQLCRLPRIFNSVTVLYTDGCRVVGFERLIGGELVERAEPPETKTVQGQPKDKHW